MYKENTETEKDMIIFNFGISHQNDDSKICKCIVSSFINFSIKSHFCKFCNFCCRIWMIFNLNILHFLQRLVRINILFCNFGKFYRALLKVCSFIILAYFFRLIFIIFVADLGWNIITTYLHNVFTKFFLKYIFIYKEIANWSPNPW